MTLPAPQIIYRDDDLLVVDKPSGVSFLADRTGEPCLWDWLTAYSARMGISPPRQVHRLDKGTSGVLLVALTRRAQSSLTGQFREHDIVKVYTAVVAGRPKPESAWIDLPLCPGRKSRFRVAGPREAITLSSADFPPRWTIPPESVRSDSHPSLTRYRGLANDGSRSLVLLMPRTGRAHQLRVHLSWLGWPILGDRLYGKPDAREQAFPRLALHCRKLILRCDWLIGSPRLALRSRFPPEFPVMAI